MRYGTDTFGARKVEVSSKTLLLSLDHEGGADDAAGATRGVSIVTTFRRSGAASYGSCAWPFAWAAAREPGWIDIAAAS